MIAAPRRASVSVVCVFNDPEMRRACLDRSLEAHGDEAEVEYLPIDNVDGSFATAGAALNHGASLASHDYLAFVHQDVYLHSLSALQAAADVLASDHGIGVLGALGIRGDGSLVGRIRDRVILLGESAKRPTDVDSLDELLFMVPRRVFEREQLSEAVELAWHAYAVDYGLRVGALGLRVCALDIPLTHNSLTVNLDRLDVAYGAIAANHPEALPLQTPGGLLTAASGHAAGGGFLRSHRWRYRWARESLAVHAARRAAGGGACVLGDIRRDIDDVLACEPSSPLLVVNLEHDPGFADERPDPLELTRRSRPVMLTSSPAARGDRDCRSAAAGHIAAADEPEDRRPQGACPVPRPRAAPAGSSQGDRVLDAARRGRDSRPGAVAVAQGDAPGDAQVRGAAHRCLSKVTTPR